MIHADEMLEGIGAAFECAWACFEFGADESRSLEHEVGSKGHRFLARDCWRVVGLGEWTHGDATADLERLDGLGLGRTAADEIRRVNKCGGKETYLEDAHTSRDALGRREFELVAVSALHLVRDTQTPIN